MANKQERIATIIRKNIAEIIQFEIRDPNLGFVSIPEVKAGFECGLLIDGFNDIKEGDIVEGYEMVEVD